MLKFPAHVLVLIAVLLRACCRSALGGRLIGAVGSRFVVQLRCQ